MRLHPLPCSLSRAGLLTEPTPAARRNVFMDPEHVEDMLAHASASFSLQLQKQERVSISANAMREMLDELMTGDVSVIDDTPVMRMPDGYMTREYGEWVAIVPALEGWVDCMSRIAPGLSSGAIVDLGNLLRAGEEITPELVMVARIQLEDQIQAMKRMPIGAINAAVESTKSDWRKEEKLKEEMTMNARDNAPALPSIDGTINAAHKALANSKAPLCAEDVAKAINVTKRATKPQIKEAEKQLKELYGLGILESNTRTGGVSFYSLTVAPETVPMNDDGCGACGDACASNGGDCRVKEESPPVCESVQAGGESQTGQSDDPVLHALGVMTRVASAARDLLHESEEFDFPDGLGRGAPQRLWDALGSEIEAAENDGAPIDDEMPPADPALLASANRMLSDRLEGVAHALRGCGLPALAEISGAEDLQMATAALSGAYQMSRDELEAAAAGQIMLSDVIANIRKAIGDDDGRIRLHDLAGNVTCRMLERNVNTQTVVDALIAVEDYLPHGYDYRLIDGIRMMDMLIDAQSAQINELRDQICTAGLEYEVLKEVVANSARLAEKMEALLSSSRHECEGLRAELATYVNGKLEVTADKKPTGYIVRTWKKEEPVTKIYAKEKTAGQAATRVVRNGEADTAFVFALVHAGTASYQASYVESKQ